MEVAQVRAFVRAHRLIAIDTCVFIYQWEANPRYWPLTDLIFSSVERSDLLAVTSTITMTEVLIHPYRENNVSEVSELFGLLSIYPNLAWVSPDLEISVRAAQIRAEHNLQTPDALQAATALETGATAIVTNDPIFKRVSNLDVLVLDDYL
ncbi:MAG: type II toxin-antitoxin system VapC family toxin [Candidatus Sulfotelmatobacter sp.]